MNRQMKVNNIYGVETENGSSVDIKPAVDNVSLYHNRLARTRHPINSIEDIENQKKALLKNNDDGDTGTVSLAHGFLDKIMFWTRHSIPSDILSELRPTRKFYLYKCSAKSCDFPGFFDRDLQIFFHGNVRSDDTGRRGYKVFLNPSGFPTYPLFLEFLTKIFGSSEILTAIIFQIDCTVDVYEPFHQEIIGVDFGPKRNWKEYFHIGRLTGVKVGTSRKSHQSHITVYDKTTESNLPYPATRYERHCGAGKATFIDLPKKLIANPFVGITRHSVSFTDQIPRDQSAIEARCRLITLTMQNGYWHTKRHLNKDRNFDRVYAKYFTIKPTITNLDSIFNQSMTDYFAAYSANSEENAYLSKFLKI